LTATAELRWSAAKGDGRPRFLSPGGGLTAATGEGGDGGGGGATAPKTAGGGGELNACGGGATVHGRAREMGQTKEGDEVVLYIALD
jgi:hypothetical protein